jgi:hypothetical protein
VLAHAVEAEPLDEQDVVAQLVARRHHQAVRPVALVEHHAQVVGTAVEHEAVALDAHRAQRRIALHAVDQLAVAAADLDLGLDQLRALGAPHPQGPGVVDAGVGQLEDARQARPGQQAAVGHQQLVAQAQRDVGDAARGHVADVGVEPDLPGGDVGGPAQLAHVGARHLLDPHRAPDAAGARVPDLVRLRLPVHLAARLVHVLRVVLGLHHDFEQRTVEVAADVDRERAVAAAVLDREAAVDPDPGAVVDGPEVQHQALVARGRHRRIELDLALVPDPPPVAAVVQAAGARFGRVRDDDGAVPVHIERIGAFGKVVQHRLPWAVEAAPGGAAELGAGVFHGVLLVFFCVLFSDPPHMKASAFANSYKPFHALYF